MCAPVAVEDSGDLAKLDGILGAGLEEGLKYRAWLLVVVVHDVHEVVRLHNVVEQLACGSIGRIELRPLATELVGLVLSQ